MEKPINFDHLVSSVIAIDHHYKEATAKAINKNFTVRNWLIGAYIVIYEQMGKERAEYGSNLVDSLSKQINKKGLSSRNLRQYRQFYSSYPSLLNESALDFSIKDTIWQTASAKSHIADNQLFEIWQTASAKLISTKSDNLLQIPNEKLLNNLSFSHFSILLSIDDPLKRTFYEVETIKGRWSITQLKRQINTLFYERSAMSKDPSLLSKIVNENLDYIPSSEEIMKDVFTFEFLGLPEKYLVKESDLEKAILDNIESFILELGHGFCFEARQQKILIDEDYYFIDLVFYHRILKCHVLIDLKVENFTHYNAGQLNVYLNYYKEKIVRADDNPPIGILFVTDKSKALVEYATAGMDQQLFAFII
jgi:predicted nuclease of restriction endonuclease-like (RecB) superfamily